MRAVVTRNEKGQWVKPPPSPAPFTQANARSMAQKRWDKARKAAASRVLLEAQAIDPTVKDEYDAHGLMVAKQYVAVLDSDKPRADDAEKIAQLMGTAPRAVELRTEQAGPAAGTATEAVIAMTKLVEAIERVVSGADNNISQADMVDASFTEAGDAAGVGGGG